MASDNFTDDNGTGLESHDANWTSIGGDFVVTGCEIQSNQCQAEGTWDCPSAYYDDSSEDCSEIVIVAGSNEASDDRHVGVRLNSNQRGYSLGLGSGDGSEWDRAYVLKNGTYHSTPSASGAWAYNTNHTLKISVSGTDTVTIDTWVDDVALTQQSDSSSPIGAGHPGFWTTEVNAVADSVYDDWTDCAAGSTEEQAVSGDMPAASGAITKKVGFNISGDMPAPAGALTKAISYNLGGDMPAAEGALIKKISAALLAGVMPSGSGSLASQIVIQQAISGEMPNTIGAITEKKVSFNVAGVLPEITGAITRKISFGVSGTMGAITGASTKALSIVGLAGDMPAGSGDLQSAMSTSQDVAGEMPAASGTVSSETNPEAGVTRLLKIIGMSLKKLIGG